METKVVKRKTGFLPVCFKKIGIAIVGLGFLCLILLKSMKLHITEKNDVDFQRSLVFDFIILGLFFIAMAREKIEDERILTVRLTAMAWAFTFISIYVVSFHLVGIVLGDTTISLGCQQTVIMMLASYIFMFYLLKRKN